jgi:hypothetical protein
MLESVGLPQFKVYLDIYSLLAAEAYRGRVISHRGLLILTTPSFPVIYFWSYLHMFLNPPRWVVKEYGEDDTWYIRPSVLLNGVDPSMPLP